MSKKAIALVLALFSMMFISLLVVAFLDIITIDQQILTNRLYGLQAEFIADGGVETAVYELRANNSYSGTGGEVTFPSGASSTYAVTVDTTNGNITSTGEVGDFSRTILAEYTLTGSTAPYTVTIDSWQ